MNWAVGMAGGRGTRFWPLSRNRHPKPFLRLLGRRTILEETVARLAPFFSPRQILVVLQSELVNQARKLLRRLPPENILGEPKGQNTAPCSVYAARQIERRDPGAKIIFLPADQFIRPKSLYLKTIRLAFELVDERPVLLAMRPDHPSASYGYLEVRLRRKKINGISLGSVLRFHEKPSAAQARRFLKRGNFFWNGGTFVWRLDAFKEAIRVHLPRIFPVFAKGTSIYRSLPSISLDYGVMEKLRNVHCLEAPFEWSDLGGWVGLAEFWPADSAKNRVQGKALFVKSRGNIVKADERLVALLGVEDLLVVDTRDALLICPQSRTEEIREVVGELERRKASRYL